MKVLFQDVLIQPDWHATHALVNKERFIMSNLPNSSPNPPYNTISFEVVPTGMQYDENTMQVPMVFQRVDEKNQVHYHLCNVGEQSENTTVVTPLEELVLNIPAIPLERVEVDDSILEKYIDLDLLRDVQEENTYSAETAIHSQDRAPKRVELPFFPTLVSDEDVLTDRIREGCTIEAKKTTRGTFEFRKIDLNKPLEEVQQLQVLETKDSGDKSHYYLIQATDTLKDVIIISSSGVELTSQSNKLKILDSGLPEIDFKSIEEYTLAVLKNRPPS